tara:strand:+ start:3711 stop:4145 length:435 start_codon:yes stop_codon:yes gene_type:complete
MTSTAKTSNIKKVVNIKEYEGKYGKTLYHDLEMENGDKINIGKKKEQQEGWELTYDIVEVGQQEYNKARAVAPEGFTPKTFTPKPQGKSDNVQLMIVKQSCLKCAVENDKTGDRSQIIDDAQYFVDWVIDNCCDKKDNKNDMPF